MRAPAAGCALGARLCGPPAILIVSAASALRRDHAGTDRIAGRARRPEDLAVGRLLQAADDRRALARGIFGHGVEIHGKATLGVECSERRFDAQPAVRQRPEAAPLKAGAQLEDLGDETLSLAIAFA